MNFFKNNYILISVLVFLASIIIAHIFAPDNYSWVRNTISDLGAQGYDRKFIMQGGFLSFGLILTIGIFLNGMHWGKVPIFIYGICIALTGIFCTKPFFGVDGYSLMQESLHSLFAQIAGVAFTCAILLRLFSSPNQHERFFHILFFILVMGCSLGFGLTESFPGIFQRLLYLVSFIWLVLSHKPS